MSIQENELHGIGIRDIPFVRAFHALEFLLFYSHRNHKGDVTIIPLTMGTR
jgi:hypothetical protein